MRYSIELGEPSRSVLFALRALRIAPLKRATYRAIWTAVRAFVPLAPPSTNCRGSTRLRFYPPREFQSNTGNIEADIIRCIPLFHKPGHCLYGGDYLIFENGWYRVFFEGNIEPYPSADDPLIIFDVFENLQNNTVIAERKIATSDVCLKRFSFHLDFWAEEGDRVEFRVYWHERSYLIISGVVLEQLI